MYAMGLEYWRRPCLSPRGASLLRIPRSPAHLLMLTSDSIFLTNDPILANFHSKSITLVNILMNHFIIHCICRKRHSPIWGSQVSKCKLRALICTTKYCYRLALWLKKAEQPHSGLMDIVQGREENFKCCKLSVKIYKNKIRQVNKEASTSHSLAAAS